MKVRTEARRDAIVQEAARLFRELGYERASMNELAQRLGASKATLYGYFPSKQDLFVAVTQALATDHLVDALAELGRLDEVGLEAGLNSFAQKIITLRVAPEAMALYRMVVGEAGRSNIGELFFEVGLRRCLEAISTALAGAVQRGELEDEPVEILAQQLLALIGAETELWIYRQEPPVPAKAHVKAMAARAVRLFLGGYARTDSKPPAPHRRLGA
ncbi:MAG TPA: TetR/AcrR family transcriptional regulator [Ramlibacter sp.]|uniref:TetR/AcrR family transcriptional regulator n=1 Tax=Ramlibacter sp. TaxID=1917967 RepID=UPI002D670007|nr:TetR/AcrR family transcriptional regulator [Ramlibacter sp.]HZY19200.1 TetR/AcrR family transcriptional regulator [Ramlibacter sp.]